MDIMDIAIAKALSGGGGGGGPSENFVFNIDISQFPTVTIDKTYAELVEADEANRNIVGNLNGQKFYLATFMDNVFEFLSMNVSIQGGKHVLTILGLSISSDNIGVDQMVLSE